VLDLDFLRTRRSLPANSSYKAYDERSAKVMKGRRTFREILTSAAPKDALILECKAQLASWLAKDYPRQASKFYQIKYASVSQLFRIPGHAPAVHEAELALSGDVILSIKYTSTSCLQHILPHRLDEEVRGQLPRWATARAAQEAAA
jgi:hypothetical protein